MKLLIFFLFIFLNKDLILGFKNSIQNKLKSCEKNSMISTGDRIDGRYRILEKTNEKTCPYMNEEWFFEMNQYEKIIHL